LADVETLLAAARRIVRGAERDVELGLHESACVGAQRGAVLATQAWLLSGGQDHASGSVHENLCLSPEADEDLRDGARLLDRHRVEEGYPHRSSQAVVDPERESEAVVAAARSVLVFVEARTGVS